LFPWWRILLLFGMVNPGQHWSCCVNNCELLRSLLIAAHSLVSPGIALSFRSCDKSIRGFKTFSSLCEIVLIFTFGFIYTSADWSSARGDKLSRCCRKCSSVSLKSELNISDAFLTVIALIEFDRHSKKNKIKFKKFSIYQYIFSIYLYISYIYVYIYFFLFNIFKMFFLFLRKIIYLPYNCFFLSFIK